MSGADLIQTLAAGRGNTRKNGRREADDFYRTPASCTRALLAREKFGSHVWEPACGDGAIAEVLTEAGHHVYSSDLVDRGYGVPRRDFLMETRLPAARSIITNPPFKLADEFVLHGLHLGADKIAMFLRLAYLEGRARYARLWSKHPPVRIYQFCGRQTLWRGDDADAKEKGGAIAFCWIVWEAGYKGDPALRWIP